MICIGEGIPNRFYCEAMKKGRCDADWGNEPVDEFL